MKRQYIIIKIAFRLLTKCNLGHIYLLFLNNRIEILESFLIGYLLFNFIKIRLIIVLEISKVLLNDSIHKNGRKEKRMMNSFRKKWSHMI
jgi:hypothetical protein